MEKVEIHNYANQRNIGKFWMVTGDMNSPKVRHTSRESAVREAERLASVHPGKEFYVLEATDVAKASNVLVWRL